MKNLARCDFSAMLGSARLFLMMGPGPKVMVYAYAKLCDVRTVLQLKPDTLLLKLPVGGRYAWENSGFISLGLA